MAGLVQAIAVDPRNPDTVYAVGGGAIFKTTNGAANWKRLYSPATSDGKANYPATLVGIDPQDSNTVYAGTATAGVFKSTDGGASWSMANRGLPKPTSYPNDFLTTFTTSFHVGVLVIDPQNPETIYAGASANYDGPMPSTPTPTLSKNTDGGASWNAARSGLTVDLINPDGTHFTSYLGVYSLAIDPQDTNTLYAAAYGSGPGGIFKSTDCGANWSASASPGPIGTLAIDPLNPNTLYVAGDGLFKSTDGTGHALCVTCGLQHSFMHESSGAPTAEQAGTR